MAATLRDLLIQRAARLQERPALTAPDWGTLTYAQFRNRVEGVALGLLAGSPPGGVWSATGTAWDWAAEVAAAATGRTWDSDGQLLPLEVLGGSRFNHEDGRGPYHGLEQSVAPATPFQAGLSQGDLLARLRRLNGRLGWDHATRLILPLEGLGTAPVRAALWSALYAGAHATLAAGQPAPSGWLGRFRAPAPPWDASPFADFWEA